MSSLSPIIVTDNLSLKYSESHDLAVNGISLAIYENEFLAIVGPSGCGKSSLLNLLGTLTLPTSGEIQYGSLRYADIANPSAFRKKNFGFIFQSFHLIPTLTAFENVLVPTLASGAANTTLNERAINLLKELGLESRINHLPSEMSGGERQRVSIARALINEPSIILADEPTGSLDSKHSKQVIEILKGIQQKHQVTVVVATHDPMVSTCADRLIYILDGRIQRIETS